jgi:hypothetical protein
MLATARVVDDDDGMRYMPWSLMLIGVSAIAVGVVGATLPPGRRLETVLALIAGGGAGIAVLGIGLAGGVADTGTDFERLFLIGSVVGTAAVAVVLVMLRRRASSTSDA